MRNYLWPIGIVVVMALFMGMTLMFVKKAFSERVDLVAPDYYYRDKMFSERLDQENALAKLGKAAITRSEQGVTIVLPVFFNGKKVKGSVQFYSPLNPADDFNVPLEFDGGKRDVKAPVDKAHMWKVSFTFESDGKKILSAIDRAMSLLLTALVMGVFSGGHCLGMCGPLVLALPVSERGFSAALTARVLYNTGRIFTYVLLGAIVGSLGAAANFKGLQKYLSYAAGGMLILISLLQLTPVLQVNFLTHAQTALRNLLTRAAGKAGPGKFTLLGVANGFLPCGMVAMALMASIAAGTLKDGVLYMLFFGLGTFPLMLAASLFGVYLKPKLRGFLAVAGPIYGVALGILLLLRPGWILPDCG